MSDPRYQYVDVDLTAGRETLRKSISDAVVVSDDITVSSIIELLDAIQITDGLAFDADLSALLSDIFAAYDSVSVNLQEGDTQRVDLASVEDEGNAFLCDYASDYFGERYVGTNRGFS